MKITKKLLSVLLAFTLVIGMFLVPTQVVNAATESYGAVPSKVRINTSASYEDFSFDLPSYGCTLANLKVNSKKVKVKQTYYKTQEDVYTEDGKTVTDNLNYATIHLYTQKEGTYKVSFDIVDANGAKVSSHLVKVYARNDSAFKSLKLGKNSVTFDATTTTNPSTDKNLLKGKSGKVQVKMAKGYKLKKIEYGVYNKEKNGVVYTQVKNKAKIAYGRLVNEYSYSYVSPYNTDTSTYKYSYWRKPAMAYTYIRVTYKDKYTKAEDTATYSFYQWVK